jgi:hypothetical protein
VYLFIKFSLVEEIDRYIHTDLHPQTQRHYGLMAKKTEYSQNHSTFQSKSHRFQHQTTPYQPLRAAVDLQPRKTSPPEIGS